MDQTINYESCLAQLPHFCDAGTEKALKDKVVLRGGRFVVLNGMILGEYLC